MAKLQQNPSIERFRAVAYLHLSAFICIYLHLWGSVNVAEPYCVAVLVSGLFASV